MDKPSNWTGCSMLYHTATWFQSFLLMDKPSNATYSTPSVNNSLMFQSFLLMDKPSNFVNAGVPIFDELGFNPSY